MHGFVIRHLPCGILLIPPSTFWGRMDSLGYFACEQRRKRAANAPCFVCVNCGIQSSWRTVVLHTRAEGAQIHTEKQSIMDRAAQGSETPGRSQEGGCDLP